MPSFSGLHRGSIASRVGITVRPLAEPRRLLVPPPRPPFTVSAGSRYPSTGHCRLFFRDQNRSWNAFCVGRQSKNGRKRRFVRCTAKGCLLGIRSYLCWEQDNSEAQLLWCISDDPFIFSSVTLSIVDCVWAPPFRPQTQRRGDSRRHASCTPTKAGIRGGYERCGKMEKASGWSINGKTKFERVFAESHIRRWSVHQAVLNLMPGNNFGPGTCRACTTGTQARIFYVAFDPCMMVDQVPTTFRPLCAQQTSSNHHSLTDVTGSRWKRLSILVVARKGSSLDVSHTTTCTRRRE